MRLEWLGCGPRVLGRAATLQKLHPRFDFENVPFGTSLCSLEFFILNAARAVHEIAEAKYKVKVLRMGQVVELSAFMRARL